MLHLRQRRVRMSFTDGTGEDAALSEGVAEIAMDDAKVSQAGAMISQATQGSDVRFERVARLQQAIDAGTYRVSSGSLAERLIRLLRD
jgi:anti-sigma28 factor (negative regulator of flagellin synthesis)